ncbi:hypothetical protein [Dendronalium sp. ChiSLP03b]|uniref:hypothetical protein n=1 Tax=Dendronalium sp. ChiSLP03b TaxID=3075381 RepID=UPI002AD32965|nr:hypothetical protein [Dendronalium sp. ChiSLP03b]MDZ8209167.1 hypothetical protein [Dendronalium sp. ChiSLP03b]
MSADFTLSGMLWSGYCLYIIVGKWDAYHSTGVEMFSALLRSYQQVLLYRPGDSG